MKKTILFILIFFCTGFAQQDKTVAKIGDEIISAEEFKKRFELTPQIKKKSSDEIDDKKSNFLYSLIAEKLWANEAENRGLDSTEIMRLTFRYLEKMLVREKLFENEIASKVNVSEAELIDAMKMYFTDLEVKVIHYEDSAKIYEVFSSLKNNASFDSLYKMQPLPLPDILISYGELNPSAEDELYDLKVGDFSNPIYSETGWFIFLIKNKIERSYTSEDVNQTISKVDAQLRQKKTDSIYTKFHADFFKDKKVEVNGDMFWRISDGLSEILSDNKSKENLSDTSVIYFSTEDLQKLEEKLDDILSEKFLNFAEDPINVKEFLRYFIFDGFYTRATDKQTIGAKLNSRVKSLIESELLSREAYDRGLHTNIEVRNEIEAWRENYLSKILKNIIVDSIKISDSEVNTYFEQASNSAQKIIEVNIVEILTDSLSVVEKVLDQLNDGIDIRELAAQHTKREWTRKNNGEFGFFSTALYDDIGKMAGQMEIGEIYGPLKIDEGYSIFKLIDKREVTNETPVTFEDSRKIVTQKKLSEAFINYTIKLADKYNIEINRSILDQINVNDYKLFSIRNFGFGGRLTAVPLTIPFSEWFEEWSKKRDDIQ